MNILYRTPIYFLWGSSLVGDGRAMYLLSWTLTLHYYICIQFYVTRAGIAKFLVRHLMNFPKSILI